jgi:hypothetical protein
MLFRQLTCGADQNIPPPGSELKSGMVREGTGAVKRKGHVLGAVAIVVWWSVAARVDTCRGLAWGKAGGRAGGWALAWPRCRVVAGARGGEPGGKARRTEKNHAVTRSAAAGLPVRSGVAHAACAVCLPGAGRRCMHAATRRKRRPVLSHRPSARRGENLAGARSAAAPGHASR